MKKLLSVFLCISFIFIIYAPAARAADVFPDAPSVRLVKTETSSNDITYRFSVSCPAAAGYEAERRALYEEMHAKYTDDMLIAAGQSWLLYETVLLAQIKAGGYTIYAGSFPVTEKSVTLTLNGDILPALYRTGLYTHDAFEYTLRFLIALDAGEEPVYASPAVTFGPLSCPATAHIEYDISPDAENPNPSFLFLPYEDYTLENPTRPGYVFAGWYSRNGFVNKIPANTRDVSVSAEWTPRSYKINYVLTTRQGYFVYVNNGANPLVHVYGMEARLYDIEAPYGYVFCGWYASADFSGKPLTAIPADTLGDVILYAKWLTPEEKDDETVKKEHWGDPDGDGSITVKDARFALRVAIGLEKATKTQTKRLDYFAAGKVTTATARQTLRFAIGLDRPADVLKLYGRI